MLDHFDFLLRVEIRLPASRRLSHSFVVVLVNCQRRIYTPVHPLCRVSEKARASTSQNDCKAEIESIVSSRRT